MLTRVSGGGALGGAFGLRPRSLLPRAASTCARPARRCSCAARWAAFSASSRALAARNRSRRERCERHQSLEEHVWPGHALGDDRARHRRDCRSRAGKRCTCDPTYRASIRIAGRRLRNTFPSEAAARLWLTDAVRTKTLGTLSPPSTQTLNEAAAETFELMRRGIVLNRNRQRYRLNVIQNYQAAYANHVAAHVGSLPLGEVRPRHLQGLADRCAPAASRRRRPQRAQAGSGRVSPRRAG